MTTDDTGPGDPSSLEDPRYVELTQDGLTPGQVQAGEPELDAYGVLAQARPARDRDRLLGIAGPICGIISAGLAITDYNHKLAGWLVALGFLAGALAIGLPAVLEKKKKKQLGVVGNWILGAGFFLGIVGICGLAVITWPNANWGG